MDTHLSSPVVVVKVAVLLALQLLDEAGLGPAVDALRLAHRLVLELIPVAGELEAIRILHLRRPGLGPVQRFRL